MVKPSGRFKKIIEASDGDTSLIPILYGYLEAGKLPDPFTINVRGGTGDRPPDGWFHPSTHPTLTERQLYLYLTEPDQWEPEAFGYTLKMSALIGSVVHDIVETALDDLGWLVRPRRGACPVCGLPQPGTCREHAVVDLKTGSRGHMDGLLETEGFEFKTAMPFALTDIRNNDVERFKARWPYYYAQVQEYMRMSGLVSFKVLFWAMGNPWDMREFTIPADVAHQLKIERKYLSVREAVKHRQMPVPCCVPDSKQSRSCPASGCPVKRM